MDFASVNKGGFFLMIDIHIHAMPFLTNHINPSATRYQLLVWIRI